MLPLLGIALVVTQQVQVQVGTPASRQTPIVRDSSNDSISAKGRGDRGVRRPVTAEDQRTAFKDATAKATLVALYFMHLKYDNRFNLLVFLASFLFVGFFISITMLDTKQYQPAIQQRTDALKGR